VAATACVAAVVLAAVFADRSLRDLGRTLARQVQPQDTVVFLNDYYFDIPFYAGLRSPVLVVDDWNDPQLTQRDNWRKELFDARRFSPPLARPVLVQPASLPQTLCTATVTWVVAHSDNLRRHPELARGAEVARHDNTVLWRVPGRGPGVNAADCPGTPSANSPDKL
jgi:hypothetical protein